MQPEAVVAGAPRKRSLVWAGYCFLSVVASFVAVHHALETRGHLYSALVYLVTNKINIVVRTAGARGMKMRLRYVVRYSRTKSRERCCLWGEGRTVEAALRTWRALRELPLS